MEVVIKILGWAILITILALLLRGAFILDSKDKSDFMRKCIIDNNQFMCEYLYNNR